MHHPSFRDPLDGPTPKWIKRKVDSSQVPEDPWGHIPGRASKVIGLTSSQKAVSSSPPIIPIIRPSDITLNEDFIANKLLGSLDRNELILACSNTSEREFLALVTPLIDKLKSSIEGEIINPEHVLLELRKKLEITLP